MPATEASAAGGAGGEGASAAAGPMPSSEGDAHIHTTEYLLILQSSSYGIVASL